MIRQRALVYNDGALVAIEEDLKGSNIDGGTLTIAGEKTAVTFAAGAWTKVFSESIEE